MNPLVSPTNNAPINPMQSLIDVLRGGANPQQLAQNILQNDPRAAQAIQQMQQECGNQNPRDYILAKCQQNGMSPNEVMGIANMLGLK